MEYTWLLSEYGIIPAARIIGGMLFKLDVNNGCNCCMICICCGGEYHFDTDEVISCWIFDHGIIFVEGLT